MWLALRRGPLYLSEISGGALPDCLTPRGDRHLGPGRPAWSLGRGLPALRSGRVGARLDCRTSPRDKRRGLWPGATSISLCRPPPGALCGPSLQRHGSRGACEARRQSPQGRRADSNMPGGSKTTRATEDTVGQQTASLRLGGQDEAAGAVWPVCRGFLSGVLHSGRGAWGIENPQPY